MGNTKIELLEKYFLLPSVIFYRNITLMFSQAIHFKLSKYGIER